MRKPRPNESYKLGDITDHEKLPAGHTKKFKFDRRMPGWRPDADVQVDSHGNKERKSLFIEEALRRGEDGKFKPFPVPRHPKGTGKAFEEPGKNGTAEEWKAFNEWILGGPISDPPQDLKDEPALTTLLRELADHARRYNASLYRLRRLHFFVYAATDASVELPPQNEPADPPLPDIGKPIDFLIEAAEADWERVTTEMNTFLEDPHSYPQRDKDGKESTVTLKVLAADMVEVNGYVVSMRVVTNDTKRTQQVGGSSSHVSISSAFYSSR